MFSINLKDSKPIFEQIIDQVSQYIALGVLKGNEQLPPVRGLARSLGINPNTVAKAYQECEHRGLIYSIPGKGSYVSENKSGIRNVKEEAYEDLYVAYQNLRKLGEKRESIILSLKEVQDD